VDVIARSLTRKTVLAALPKAVAVRREKSVTGASPAQQRGFVRWRGFWGTTLDRSGGAAGTIADRVTGSAWRAMCNPQRKEQPAQLHYAGCDPNAIPLRVRAGRVRQS